MKLGTQTASLVNHIVTNAKSIIPVIGMGATVCMWTDRHAGTVIAWDGKTVTIQQDNAKRIDSLGMTDCQSYEYTKDENGQIYKFRFNEKAGKWKEVYTVNGKEKMAKDGMGLWMGTRDEHYDFTF